MTGITRKISETAKSCAVDAKEASTSSMSRPSSRSSSPERQSSSPNSLVDADSPVTFSVGSHGTPRNGLAEVGVSSPNQNTTPTSTNSSEEDMHHSTPSIPADPNHSPLSVISEVYMSAPTSPAATPFLQTTTPVPEHTKTVLSNTVEPFPAVDATPPHPSATPLSGLASASAPVPASNVVTLSTANLIPNFSLNTSDSTSGVPLLPTSQLMRDIQRQVSGPVAMRDMLRKAVKPISSSGRDLDFLQPIRTPVFFASGCVIHIGRCNGRCPTLAVPMAQHHRLASLSTPHQQPPHSATPTLPNVRPSIPHPRNDQRPTHASPLGQPLPNTDPSSSRGNQQRHTPPAMQSRAFPRSPSVVPNGNGHPSSHFSNAAQVPPPIATAQSQGFRPYSPATDRRSALAPSPGPAPHYNAAPGLHQIPAATSGVQPYGSNHSHGQNAYPPATHIEKTQMQQNYYLHQQQNQAYRAQHPAPFQQPNYNPPPSFQTHHAAISAQMRSPAPAYQTPPHTLPQTPVPGHTLMTQSPVTPQQGGNQLKRSWDHGEESGREFKRPHLESAPALGRRELQKSTGRVPAHSRR
ncbi:hypothetical protein DL96DRAFT_494309 [Flagelloscypha sp. PMI_526]|nr:hypothetical protein DL96DRAFT_494309 [Flagelloscypha sp. PMI_526]